MRPLLPLFLLIASLSAFAADTTTAIKGVLLDTFCYDRLKPKGHLEISSAMHSRDCLRAPLCSRGGFGVLTEDKRYIKFDQDGNEKVRKFIATFSRETDIRITVTGAVDGDKMTITKIELQQ
ncbi:MAG TPA: hypothetical protein VKY85_06100 [Candidatus Angelobacter sp.]|nr:hypothetical protein [Candidatus Angelobacter sp.]